MVSNGRKAGISMVALVITIIVLIILTSAVVITGIGAPKQAQLAVFYSNIDTVQDLVSVTMGDNMITGALYGYGENYKWAGIADGYTETIAINNPDRAVGFATMQNLANEELVRIDSTLLSKTSIADGEKTKYYVSKTGKVYYEGFDYEGNTYYNKNLQVEGVGQILKTISKIRAIDIKQEPTKYYGAYVDYKDKNGDAFRDLDDTVDLEWRIFYADNNNIYLTTTGAVGKRSWSTGKAAVDDMTLEKTTYLNSTYAKWATDGITYDIFKNSYNDIVGENAQALVGSQAEGYSWTSNTVDRLTETLQEDLYNYGGNNWYRLASRSTHGSSYTLGVSCYGMCVGYDICVDASGGIRPLVCLKHNVQLIEKGEENGYMTYNINTIAP